MGSIGSVQKAGSTARTPGSITFTTSSRTDATVSRSDFTDEEINEMEKNKLFAFEIRPTTNAPYISVMDKEGREIAGVKIWYAETEVFNRMTGGESQYKSFKTALNGITRQYNNMLKRRQEREQKE